MRRASHQRSVSCDTTSSTPPIGPTRAGLVGTPPRSPNSATSTAELAAADELRSPPAAQTKVKGAGPRKARRGKIELTIRQRIESRLPGRVRNLNVCIVGSKVVLEGQCATYYTKQLAQHAALGVLEDEQLENSIVVSVPR